MAGELSVDRPDKLDDLKTIGDIEVMLGIILEGEMSEASLRFAYQQAILSGVSYDLAFSGYKIVRDSYFRGVLKHYGTISAVRSAGYINDGLSDDELNTLYRPDIITSCLSKMQRRAAELHFANDGSKPLVVLIATGAFAPVHPGHIEMLEIAADWLSAIGYCVIGGLIAPEHDTYVSSKPHDASHWPAVRRIEALDAALATHGWVVSDSWACYHVPTEILFTEIIERTRNYLALHIDSVSKIDVVHVFGGDHAEQARAFVAHGMCVCVNRAGYENSFEAVKREFALLPGHCAYFADQKPASHSSTAIRLALRGFSSGCRVGETGGEFNSGQEFRQP